MALVELAKALADNLDATLGSATDEHERAEPSHPAEAERLFKRRRGVAGQPLHLSAQWRK